MFHRTLSNLVGLIVVVAVAGSVGCGQNDPPPFRLDMRNVVSKQISPDHQQAIADILAGMFGTPDEPFALPETGLNQRRLRMAAGPVWSDEHGGKHGLYRRHCAHCHGISGDGRGPTAAILNPYPRDYRRGVYKFKSTYPAMPPTDDDLRRVIYDGIPGTAMPSFALLPPDEIDALVEYVKYLSIRGQMETALVDYVSFELDADDPLDPAADPELREILVEDLLAEVMEAWEEAPDQVIRPDDSAIPPADRTPQEIADSIAKGRELFFSATKGNCMQCHGPTGLGDGQQDDFDDWSKATNEFIKFVEESELSAGERRMWMAHVLTPRNAIPRNLRDGVYRGGQRPIDVFWRVWAGIPGMPMPGVGPAMEGAPATLTQEEIWNIVDYVQSLPYEQVSRPQRRPVNVGAVAR